jgi:hypothetical protein
VPDLLPAPPHDPEAVREATDALLVQQHYQHGMNLGRSEDVERFIDRLWDTVGAFVNALIDMQETNPALYWLVVLGLITAAGLLIWHITYSVRRSSRAAPSTSERIGDLIEQADHGSLWQQFHGAVDAGELGLALRFRFAIAVAEVIGMARLKTLAHLTYRELVAITGRSDGGEALELDAAVSAIEETLYAGRELDEDRFERRLAGLGGRERGGRP